MNGPAIENDHQGSVARVALLSALLSGVACFVVWDHHRVNRDFRLLKTLFTDARCQTAGRDRTLVARFVDKSVSITNNERARSSIF